MAGHPGSDGLIFLPQGGAKAPPLFLPHSHKPRQSSRSRGNGALGIAVVPPGGYGRQSSRSCENGALPPHARSGIEYRRFRRPVAVPRKEPRVRLAGAAVSRRLRTACRRAQIWYCSFRGCVRDGIGTPLIGFWRSPVHPATATLQAHGCTYDPNSGQSASRPTAGKGTKAPPEPYSPLGQRRRKHREGDRS